jgi:hypothetical protein
MLFARVAITVTVFVFLAAAALTVAFVDDRRENGGALSAATVSPIPAATADPRVLTQSGADPGYKRITSPLGGWSMELPAAWTARPARVRGAEIASFDMSSAQLSGNAPSADQLRMNVTLQPIFDGRTLEQLGMDGVPPFLLIEQSHVTIAGMQAVRTTHRAYQPTGSPFDLLHVRWTFLSPHFPDRVTTIDVWPADTALRGVADRAVASLQFASAGNRKGRTCRVPDRPRGGQARYLSGVRRCEQRQGTARGTASASWPRSGSRRARLGRRYRRRSWSNAPRRAAGSRDPPGHTGNDALDHVGAECERRRLSVGHMESEWRLA